eukprot:6192331-Pleurochrysis_carterae.AAC.2
MDGACHRVKSRRPERDGRTGGRRSPPAAEPQDKGRARINRLGDRRQEKGVTTRQAYESEGSGPGPSCAREGKRSEGVEAPTKLRSSKRAAAGKRVRARRTTVGK